MRQVMLGIIAVVVFAACGSSGAKPESSSTTTVAPANPTLTVTTENGTDASTGMTYKLVVPKVSGLSAAAQDSINNGFANVAHDALHGAIDDARQAGACTSDCGNGSQYTCATGGQNGTQFIDARTVSMHWTCSEILAGGAHGNEIPLTATFDAKTGQQVQLPDLFADGSTYLDTLSTSARAQLGNVYGYDPSFSPDGSSAKSSNFKHFNLTQNGLQITFEDYQVAPYALGNITVTIPYSDLQVVARPGGLLTGR